MVFTLSESVSMLTWMTLVADLAQCIYDTVYLF